MPLRVAANGLAFQFELNDGNGFMHLRHQLRGACQTRVVLKILGLPDRARIIPVGGHGKIRQRQQVDTVSLFEGFDIDVPDRDAQYRGNQRLVSRHRTHPFDIMVTPLYVVVAHGGEHI